MKPLVNRRFVIAVLTVAFLMGVLLAVAPIRSSTSSPGGYDPWLDINDDGKIDMKDIGSVARAFGTSGTSVSKASIEYDSGWINITDKCGQDIVITHSLNSTDLIVDIQGKTSLSSGPHQRNYGLAGYMLGWNKTYGGTDYDYAHSLVQTTDGGYAVAGYTYSFGAGGYDFWLVKTDASGNALWNKTYGGTRDDCAYALVQTSDGGYALAGVTSSFGAGNGDFWLVKTDANGNMQWSETYGGTVNDAACALVQTSDGGYAVAGSTNSFGAGGYDFWLVKTDFSGNMQWNKTYGGTDYDYAHALVQTADGGYALAGDTYSFGAGYVDFWLVKTDFSGNMQWNKTYGGTDWDTATALVQTSDGGYALAGSTASFGAGSDDVWLVKTDSSGNMQWNKTYGGTGYDWAYALVQTGDGGYALAGSFGSDDFWLVKTDASGNAQWNKTYGGTSYEWAFGLVQTGDGGYALAGKKESPGAATNIWLVKTDDSGNAQWNRTYVETNNMDQGALVKTADGGYALASGTYYYGAGSDDFWLVKVDSESGLAWVDSSANTITLYRGATDTYWNYVRVRLWKPHETP